MPAFAANNAKIGLVRRQDLMLGLAWVPLAPPVPRSVEIGSLGDVECDDGSKAGLLASTGRGGGIFKVPIWHLEPRPEHQYLPYAFTEQGVAMLSSVLQSPRAVQVNIAIMRAFVQLRETLSLHKELAHKLTELERRIESHDAGIRTLFEAIRQLMASPALPAKKPIGFHVKENLAKYQTRRNCVRPQP